MDDAPLVELVDGILLSSFTQRAKAIRIARDDRGAVVTFIFARGEEREETRPPEALFEPIMRRLSVMARLPYYAKGEAAKGQLHLTISEHEHAYFNIRVEGHGPEQVAVLHLHTERPSTISD